MRLSKKAGSFLEDDNVGDEVGTGNVMTGFERSELSSVFMHLNSPTNFSIADKQP